MLPKTEKGYVHIYTGEGKGKTTAALGLALRAVGAGKKVFIGQFAKGQIYSEIDAISQHLPNIIIKQYGLRCFIEEEPDEDDKNAALKGLDEVKKITNSEEYDLIILDEINIAILYDLVSLEEVVNLVKNKAEKCELVLTGRYAPYELMQLADLVTEMREVKHYFRQGVGARKGIEC